MRIHTGKHGEIEYKVIITTKNVQVFGLHRHKMTHGGEKLMRYILEPDEVQEIVNHLGKRFSRAKAWRALFDGTAEAI